MRGRIDELNRQLNNANDELRDLRTSFGQVTSYNELLVRENAELKSKLKGKGRARDDEDDDEEEDEDTGDSRQTKRQRRVTHSSEEDEEVEDERARVSFKLISFNFTEFY